ncbi:hypothetical protein GS896_25195 [Rhodococcus hoagii]|nr:hypothetical protein [Prescottella equi]MBM4654064.1 hypothetical protein [Prescottella equi]MBM4654199.1 hypothetical protein [Prescottella equi]MBM4719673.1 hypothetical protein [Prescottella equi]NKR23470.1 hypothetical protein [Prescottella equi]
MSAGIERVASAVAEAADDLCTDELPGLRSVARLQVLTALADRIAGHGDDDTGMTLEQASMGQFWLAASSITGALAHDLHSAATPGSEADRMAALDELDAALRETGAQIHTCGPLVGDPAAIRAIAASIRLGGVSVDVPESTVPSTPFMEVLAHNPAPGTLDHLVGVLDRAASGRRGLLRWVTSRTPEVRRADVLIDTIECFVSQLPAAGPGAAPAERAAFENLAKRARWHRDRLRN